MEERGRGMLYPHVSVDCVLLSILDDRLCVLLMERRDVDGAPIGFKLPGSLIYETEDLDDAAYRVLNEATGLKRVMLKQFRSFGSPLRTSNKEDVLWLENASLLKINRIVTVAYLALCKPTGKALLDTEFETVQWCPIERLPRLPFDNKEIIEAAVQEIREWIEREPAIVFSYLRSKFTAAELRRTYEILYNKKMDIRNFHKRMKSLHYIIPTDDVKEGLSHRSPRYFRFDKVVYNKQRARLNKTQ